MQTNTRLLKLQLWLKNYVNKVNDLNAFEDVEVKANHVLINEYLSGQGIMPHSDGDLFYPTVATITCGSHTVIEFTENSHVYKDEPVTGKSVPIPVLLERRSLFLVKEGMYKEYKHGIHEITEDLIHENIRNLQMTQSKVGEVLTRNTRISLTIRNVPKINKFQLKLLKK